MTEIGYGAPTRKPRQDEFWQDENGNPTGGFSTGQGYQINWQNGVQEPNGAIIEDVLESLVARLQFFQETKFSCRENALAITHFQEGLHWLFARTRSRLNRGVEGTYEV